jgi:hypothetical protein
VIDATQSAFFDASEEHRRSSMRTKGVDQSDVALRVAEGNKIFA